VTSAGALADFDRTIELDPKKCQRIYPSRRGQQNKGDLDGAIADYEQGLELDPNLSAPSATGALPGWIRAISTGPSPISIVPSNSTQNPSLAMLIAGWPSMTKATSPGPLPTTTAPSNSIPNRPLLTANRGSTKTGAG